MNEVWVLSVRTSLPNVCSNSGDLTVSVEAFDSFSKGRDALRSAVKKYAFSRNSMFDGNGNITYLLKYASDVTELDEDFSEWLSPRRIHYVIDSLREAFSGKDIDFEMESTYCGDGLIAIESEPGGIAFRGEDDGPYNGYDPDIRTNIFSMTEKKHYYLYIDDAFGQDECTSKLYIDLQKAVVN